MGEAAGGVEMPVEMAAEMAGAVSTEAGPLYSLINQSLTPISRILALLHLVTRVHNP